MKKENEERERALPKIIIVIPCYNEEEALPTTIAALSEKLRCLKEEGAVSGQSGLLFVDDGSSDATWEIIRRGGEAEPALSGIRLSKNVGHQNALMAGMKCAFDARADGVITIDADLQQDIDAMDEFIRKYKDGADIVCGIRTSRDRDGFLKRTTAGVFYGLMRFLGTNVIENHADYRLLSREALGALLEYSETQLFLRGSILELGFRIEYVYFYVKERTQGKSKYSPSKMFSLALNGITSFSIRPMHFICYCGLIVMLISIGMIIYNIAIWAKGIAVPGWSSILCSIWFLGGLVLFFLGVIGEYLGRTYMEVKRRPLFHIWERVNIDE